ncbi:MAG: hypothetical protein R2706_05700 [Acidimicrobiales bacterium]
MIDAAGAAGVVETWGTIVEPTSGNTGVGLAIVAAQRGYDCIFVVTDKVGVRERSTCFGPTGRRSSFASGRR